MSSTGLRLLKRFVWDETKDQTNTDKHGVSFEPARRVFDHPLHLGVQDRVEAGEARWQAVGMIGSVVVLVAHTRVEQGDDEEIRIVSARKAAKRERKAYEQGS